MQVDIWSCDRAGDSPANRAVREIATNARVHCGFLETSASGSTGTQLPCEQLNAMPFRISEECPAGAPATYRLAGRLAGDAVEVLLDACVGIAAGAIIDLAEVSYADDAGLRALGELRGTRRGAAWLEAISHAAAAGG